MKVFICGMIAAAVILMGLCLNACASPDENSAKSGGIVNGDFSDETNGWTIAAKNISVSEGTLVVSGDECRVSQTVEGLENGVYDLTAYAFCADISGICYLYAKTDNHTIASTSVPSGGDMQRIIVPGIIVENGKCDIGLYCSDSSEARLKNLSLSKSGQSRVQFLKGGEISKLTYIEDMNGRFYREDGSEGDALQIMAENGFNCARIRILNNPGKGHGDGYFYLPENYQTESDCLELARRAKDKGMKILFSFAYSDTWSDGANQFMPYEWQRYISENNLSGEDMYSYLENSVYEYTKDIMHKLIMQGTCPEFVSVGNEIQLGMFFGNYNAPIGNLYSNSENLARFLNAGARAVRETSPETKIVLHTDNGGKVYNRSVFINALRITDFDVIGVSYYPYYNNDVSIDTVVNEFNKLINEFDKDVIIMETGYNWNEKKPDGWKGQLEDSGYYTDIYGETQNGQRAFLTELYSKLKQVSGGRCIGDLYWDPVMIYDGGTNKIGWAVSEKYDAVQGNVVSNSTIFDFNGKAVEGQKAMKYNTNANDNINITGKISGGKVRGPVTFEVNGKKYNIKPDRFGEYIISVPYPAEGKFEITAKGCAEHYNVGAPDNGILIRDINFSAPAEGTEPDEIKPEMPPVSYIAKVREEYDKDALKFKIDYISNNKDAVLYTAVYNENGEFIECRRGAEGEINLKEGAYTLKSFLWDNIRPLCKCETKKIRAAK